MNRNTYNLELLQWDQGKLVMLQVNEHLQILRNNKNSINYKLHEDFSKSSGWLHLQFSQWVCNTAWLQAQTLQISV